MRYCSAWRGMAGFGERAVSLGDGATMSVGSVGRRFLARVKNLGSTEGIAITEYGMLIALVALALIAVLTIFGGGISTWFAAKTGQITTV
jgi:Flp pilus assembly pilin Flp